MGDPVRVAVFSDITERVTYLADLIRSWGYAIVGVGADGAEAIELARREQPDLMVLDHYLTTARGAEACRAIRTEVPDVRVVLISIQGDAHFLRMGLAAGASDYLVLPVSREELAESLEQALKRSAPPPAPEPAPVTGARRGFWASQLPRHSGAAPGATSGDEPVEDAFRLNEVDAAAVALGPPNRDKRVRRVLVASLEVEYMPGQWTQTYRVDFHPRTGTWTVWDIRASGDGAGSTASDFETLEDAVAFVAKEISEHGDNAYGLEIPEVGPDDRVELRRFIYRLRALLPEDDDE